jgi:hypothetical protein
MQECLYALSMRLLSLITCMQLIDTAMLGHSAYVDRNMQRKHVIMQNASNTKRMC